MTFFKSDLVSDFNFYNYVSVANINMYDEGHDHCSLGPIFWSRRVRYTSYGRFFHLFLFLFFLYPNFVDDMISSFALKRMRSFALFTTDESRNIAFGFNISVTYSISNKIITILICVACTY